MIHTSKSTTKIVMFYICNEQRILYEAFIDMHNAGERVTPSGICVRAGLSAKYLFKERIQSNMWKKELYKLCNASLATWEINGNGLLAKAKVMLKDIQKNGKRPNAGSISIALGYGKFFLSINKGNHPWVKNLNKVIKNYDKHWKKKGGWECKAIRKELASCKKLNEEPSIKRICSKQNIYSSSLVSRSFEWQNTIYQEMLDAREDWKEKRNKPILLTAELKTEKKAHLQKLKLVIYTPEELYEQFIRQGQEIDSYRNIGLKLDSPNPLALSILMYHESKGIFVDVLIDPTSFNPKRKHLIDGCIKIINSNLSTITTSSHLHYIYKAVRYVKDLENSIPLPLNLNDAKVFYREYTNHLIRKFYMLNTTNVQNKAQISVKKLLSLMFSRDEYKNIIRGVPDVPIGTTNPLTVEIDEGTHALSFYFNIFHQIADFIIEKKTLPYPISFNTRRMLITPLANQIIQHEDRIYNSHKGNKKNVKKYFNFKESRLKSHDEVALFKSDKTKKHTIDQLKKMTNAIDIINEAIKNDKVNSHTTQLLWMAITSFFMLLSGFSGQTQSTLKNAEWEGDDEFNIIKDGYRTRTIKPRANYRRFSFPISIYAKNALRKYLILRRMWIKHSDLNTLFPPGICYKSIYQNFHLIYPDLPKVGTMKMRQMYNQVILKKSGGDLILAANILGHTLKANVDHYNDSPQALVYKQISEYVNHMVRLLHDEDEIQTKHSACVNYQNPESYIDKYMQLDCRNIFHCFLCKHFRTHPTDEDIHKLISFLYILTFYLTGRAHGNNEFVEDAIKPTETIIKKILKFMADKYGVEKLIDKIHGRVFRQGKLAQGWDEHFTLIKRMGGF